jgi:hypothetical protein
MRLLRLARSEGETKKNGMTICSRGVRPARFVLPLFALALVLAPLDGRASPLSPATRARLAGGQFTWGIVEVDARTTDQNAEAERALRRMAPGRNRLLSSSGPSAA